MCKVLHLPATELIYGLPLPHTNWKPLALDFDNSLAKGEKVWKFQDFPVIHILREIDFGERRF